MEHYSYLATSQTHPGCWLLFCLVGISRVQTRLLFQHFFGQKQDRSLRSIWVFPKILVPQNGWFIMEKPIKMIWGYPYFWKHPNIFEVLFLYLLQESQEKQMETTALSRVSFLKEKHGVSPGLWFVESKRSSIFLDLLGLFPSMNGGAWKFWGRLHFSGLNQILDNSLHKCQICVNLL